MTRDELPIAGMTCRACERRVARALTAVPGVVSADVSVRRARAVVRTERPVRRAALVAAVRAAGYEVGAADRPWLNPDRRVWRDVLVATAAVGALVAVAAATGLTDVAGRAAADGTAGLAVVLVLGIAAGLSTCMALVGGIVLAASATFAAEHPELSTRQRLRPHLAFGVGRVVGFALLGALMGAVGSLVSIDARLVAVLVVVVSLVMGVVGLRLTQVSPRLAGAGFALPPALATALRLDRDRRTYSDGVTALLGAGSFFLPCGFTQAVQVLALSTGSPVRAGSIMAVFALGTAPGLLGLGGLTATVRGAAADRFFRYAGVAVVAFALINTSGALHVLTPGLFTSSGAPLVTLSDNVTLVDGVQVLRTTQVADGYRPADAAVYVGMPVRWEIQSDALTCAATIRSADLGIDVNLDPGENEVTFTPERTGVMHYSCLMGMYTGSITVLDAPAA